MFLLILTFNDMHSSSKNAGSCYIAKMKVRVYHVQDPSPANLRQEVGGINEKTHETAAEGASNRDSHDPGEQQETNTLPVDSAQLSVAKTDTDGGTGDTHGGRDGKRVLGEDQNSDSSAKLHR